jgi:Putative Actinobacterial Holin-X, holin superfamily III
MVQSVVDPSQPPGAVPPTASPRTTGQLVRDIAADTSTLVRQEVELARQELVRGVTTKMVGAGAVAGAGVFVLYMVLFLALSAGAALSLVLPVWAAAQIVAGIFLLMAVPLFLIGRHRLKSPPIKPEETVRTVKEDVEWARAQLKR